MNMIIFATSNSYVLMTNNFNCLHFTIEQVTNECQRAVGKHRNEVCLLLNRQFYITRVNVSHCSLIVCILFSSISWASSPWLSADLGPSVWCYPTMSHQDNCIVMSHIVFNSHTNLSVTFTRENMPHAAGACILPHPYSHIHCNGQSNISYSEKDLPFRLFHPSIDSLGYSLYPI